MLRILATYGAISVLWLTGCASYIEGGNGSTASTSTGGFTPGGSSSGASGGSGSGSATCSNQCTMDTCAGGQFVGCYKAADGCMKKLAPADCENGQVCKYGIGCTYCTSQADCSDSLEVCSPTESCVYYGGQTYEITIKSATYDSKDAEGYTWDLGSDPPDPRICIYHGDAKVGCTGFFSNTYSANFEETFTVKLNGLEDLGFVAFDVDAIADDHADGIAWPKWVQIVKNGGYSGDMYDGAVWFSFDIVPAGY